MSNTNQHLEVLLSFVLRKKNKEANIFATTEWICDQYLNQLSFQLKDGPRALKSMILRSGKLEIICAYSHHNFLLHKPWQLL